MKTVIKLFKLIGGLIISIGVGALVKNVLVMVTPPGAKVAIRICMMVGGYFLGGLAAKAASDAFEDKVDNSIIQLEKVSKLIDSHEEKIEVILKET